MALPRHLTLVERTSPSASTGMPSSKLKGWQPTSQLSADALRIASKIQELLDLDPLMAKVLEGTINDLVRNAAVEARES